MAEKAKGSMFKGAELVYQLEGRPPLRVALPLGLQHVLSMFIGNLAPVLVLAGIVNASTGQLIITPEQRMLMVQCCMFASGVTTFVQLYPLKFGGYQIGAGLPIVMGTAFAFVPTLRTLGAEFGINVVLGSVIVGGVVEILMGFFIRPLKKFFPPLVIGAVLMTIGMHLLPVGVQYFAGGAAAEANAGIAANLIAQGKEVPANVAALAAQFASWQNLVIGFSVFIVILLLQRLAKGMLKISAILIGIAVGYVVAIILGQVNFQQVTDAGIFALPIPLSIRPEFRLDAILAVAAIFVVSGLETMGNINGITVAAFDREATTREMSGAVMADAAGSMFAALFNTLPNTAFGQNAGIVAMTKVVNKFCIATGAAVLVLAGFVPKIGAVFAAMPYSVLGGAVVTVFAMIMLNGIKLIAKAGFSDRNLLILAITFGVAYAIGDNKLLIDHLPAFLQYIFKDSIVAVCVFSITLNLLFPPSEEEKARLKKAQEEAALEDLQG
ncbi:MAG: purine permease [Spirochaetaceae bacterium]|jgi:NCS2 family nucleobase:cation symporter-2|nr:purine permease [Spirochaetaceae bacterium]